MFKIGDEIKIKPRMFKPSYYAESNVMKKCIIENIVEVDVINLDRKQKIILIKNAFGYGIYYDEALPISNCYGIPKWM